MSQQPQQPLHLSIFTMGSIKHYLENNLEWKCNRMSLDEIQPAKNCSKHSDEVDKEERGGNASGNDYFEVDKESLGKEPGMQLNKAVYTDKPITCCWAGAVMQIINISA